MKRRLRISWLYLLACCGFSLPGLGYPEAMAALRSEYQAELKYGRARGMLRGRGMLPPRHGPEQLVPLELSAVERELWRCIQGEHGSGCG